MDDRLNRTEKSIERVYNLGWWVLSAFGLTSIRAISSFAFKGGLNAPDWKSVGFVAIKAICGFVMLVSAVFTFYTVGQSLETRCGRSLQSCRYYWPNRRRTAEPKSERHSGSFGNARIWVSPGMSAIGRTTSSGSLWCFSVTRPISQALTARSATRRPAHGSSEWRRRI